MERSAMSDRQKRVSLTQEVIRILRNTKKELPDCVKNDLLSEFSLRMMLSGYSENFRLEVISSGVAGYEKQLARAEAGTCPLYRPKGYMKEERRKKKLIKKRSWYKPFSTVLFCPPSPCTFLCTALARALPASSAAAVTFDRARGPVTVMSNAPSLPSDHLPIITSPGRAAEPGRR